MHSYVIQVKGLSKEELEARSDLVAALKDRIEGIPDGSTAAAKQTGGGTTSASYTGIKFDTYSGTYWSSFIEKKKKKKTLVLSFFFSFLLIFLL